MYQLTSLYLYITDDCNQRCRHCWIDPSFNKGSLKEKVGADVIEKAIVEAKELGLRRVKLTGGEPLLREDILEIFDMLDRSGVIVDIETNGTLISDEIASKFSGMKRGTISISLDSYDADKHDKFRGVKGAFSQTIKGIENLKKHKIPFQVISSFYKQNVGDIDKTADLVKKLGASSFKINPVTPFGRAKDIYENNENLTITEILDINKRSANYSKKYKMPVYMTIPPVFRPFDDFQKGGIGTCHVLNILGVLYDGTVSFCGVGKEEKDLVMGNIKTDSIKDIWETSPILKRMREEIPDKFEGLCGRCIFKGFCLGECVAITYSMKKSFTDTFWLCEMADKEGIFPKNRLV